MLADIILKPVITEKATKLAGEGKYIFIVRKNATKIDVKNAVKALYNADASKVNIIRTKEKYRLTRRGQPVRKHHSLKKVIVTLKGRKIIDIYKIKGLAS